MHTKHRVIHTCYIRQIRTYAACRAHGAYTGVLYRAPRAVARGGWSETCAFVLTDHLVSWKTLVTPRPDLYAHLKGSMSPIYIYISISIYLSIYIYIHTYIHINAYLKGSMSPGTPIDMRTATCRQRERMG